MSRNALFAGRDVCMPHPPSAGAGIPWVAHPISDCDTCALLQTDTSRFNSSTCHNITVPLTAQCCTPGLRSCNLTSALPIMTDLLLPNKFHWCVEAHPLNSPRLGEIPSAACNFVYNVDEPLSSTGQYDNKVHPCLRQARSWFKLWTINKWCKILDIEDTYWLCGTSIYSELPVQLHGQCTLVYALPAIRENVRASTSQDTLQLKDSAPPVSRENDCIPGLTCTQTWWSRTLGPLIPSYGVMQALDQVRSLSNAVQKLANDTALAIGNISNTLASHKIMILQNRVALDYILATQGGTCTIIGPECCTGLVDPTDNLDTIQKDLRDLSLRLHNMTMENSSWFRNVFGESWLWIKNTAVLFLSLLFLLCISSYLIWFCMRQAFTPSRKEVVAISLTEKTSIPDIF